MTDFGHMHIDNVKGSDINQNDMGHDGDTWSGNSSYGDSDDINQGDWFMHSNYLKTDGFTGTLHTYYSYTIYSWIYVAYICVYIHTCTNV